MVRGSSGDEGRSGIGAGWATEPEWVDEAGDDGEGEEEEESAAAGRRGRMPEALRG